MKTHYPQREIVRISKGIYRPVDTPRCGTMSNNLTYTGTPTCRRCRRRWPA